jgi:hypothetical protein
MNHSKNLVRIKAVYNALGPLKDQVVFVGGATVAFYVDRMAEEVRPTDDVDVVVEIWTYREYAALEEQLRRMGFANDTASGVICRYRIQGIIVDIIPTGENVLGFKNKWYPDGYKKLRNAPADVKIYLQEKFNALLANPYFFEWVDGHVSYGSPPATYSILQELEAFAKGK